MILDLEAFRKLRDADRQPPVEVESQLYMLDRVLKAGLVHWHIMEDHETAEELFRIVEAAYFAGELLVPVSGRSLRNIRKVLNPDPDTGQDPPLVRLYQRLSRKP